MGLQQQRPVSSKKRVDFFWESVIFITINGAVLVSTDFFDCGEHVEVDHLASLKRRSKITANRLTELAAMDFSFSMEEESVGAELAFA